MKVKFYHWYNAILASLLSMLGFSGCDGSGKDMYGSPIMEYGTPYADYQVKPYRNREWMRTGDCADCRYWRYCQGNGMHLRDGDGHLLLCHLKRLQK